MTGGLTILVLAKAPVAGLSKTRLAPRFGPVGAAQLAAAALADTLAVVRRTPCTRRVLVLDGQLSDDWRTTNAAGFEVLRQVRGTHGERIRAALEIADGAALLIGMDTPQVSPALLQLDLDDPVEAWLGLAADGGWWALGLRHARRDAAEVLADVPMSTDRTGSVQRRRLDEAGLRVAPLLVLRDVDEPDDALAVAALAPATRFAACLRDLVATVA